MSHASTALRGTREDEPTRPSDDTTPLLQRRLRAGLVAGLAPILLFALADLYLFREQLALSYGLKAVAVGVIAAAVMVLRRPRSRAVVIAVALLAAAVLYAISTASAIAAREPLTTPLLNISIALATATLLPWGAGPQLALVGTAIAAAMSTTYLVTGQLTHLVQYPSIGVLVGLGVSVYIARAFDRSHRDILRHQAEQARAEAEVRQLNSVLERRVAVRTAALERLNQELQAEIERRASTEAQLRQSQASLSALVESTDAAIWSVDCDFHLTAYNSVAHAGFTRRFGGAITDVETILPVEAQSHWHALYRRALAGERFSAEHEMQLEGRVRYLLTSFAPIVTDGVVTGVSVFSSDVTKRKVAEEAARQHQAQLTHVLRLSTMGEMAAGLAHEINQPLGAIANFATGCARRLRDGTMQPDDVLGIVEQIAAEALRAGTIIRRLRSLIRKEDSRHEWTNLNELVADAVRLLASDLRHAGITVSFDLSDAVRPAHVDSIQIEQVLLNLLRNAMDAVAEVPPARREIRIATALVGDEHVEINVSDRGTGLAADIGDTIFDPFVSTKPNGLGLGLSISRTIIESHGGRLWAHANPEGGATFTFQLPIQAQTEATGSGHTYRRSA
jgi:PAS domain S-box-containing protein